MDNKSIEMYDAMPVHKAVMKNAFPAMVAMLMVLIYNLADTYFVSQTNDALQVAAVSLAMPVFLIFTALGTVFGIGGTSVIARARGEGRKDYARKVSAFCMWSCVGIGVVIAVLLLLFMDKLLVLVGASADTFEHAKNYLSIAAFCGPFVLVGNCYSNILRAEGQATHAMMGMLIGNLVNVVLDPLMILGLGWGITGAAVATVIGNIIGALYYIVYFLRGKSTLSINIKEFTIKNGVCKGVFAIGIPASLGSLLMSLSQIIANSQMSSYSDMAVAGFGVAMRMVMIIGMLCIGLAQGIQPLLGYSVGAKNWTRFKETLRFSLKFALVVSCVLTGLCYLLVNQIVGAFLADETAFSYGVQFSKILLSTNALFGVFYVMLNALQAAGAAGSSLVINLSRQGLIYIPMLFLLNTVLGINGIVWAQPIADVLSTILAVGLSLMILKKMMKEDGQKKSEPMIRVSEDCEKRTI